MEEFAFLATVLQKFDPSSIRIFGKGEILEEPKLINDIFKLAGSLECNSQKRRPTPADGSEQCKYATSTDSLLLKLLAVARSEKFA